MTNYLSVEDFKSHQLPHIGKLIAGLQELIMNAHPKMQEHFSINTPMYKVKHDVCYIGKIHPKKGLELCFLRGYQLSNEQGLLDAKGRKYIQGITFTDIDDLQNKKQSFIEILNEALILDEMNERNVFTDMLQTARRKKS
ncbi:MULTISPECIES: DUF1801 domain-containing protein [Emticicia]|uniref:DUF1801 domain-containing protein n=1 Tax=Emticicia TaxID=312278 RepID=UPI00209FA528|nr:MULTISPECIES: DUF1801 domain-containing protein [Emticicia]UTA70086.1 DUF1801 domain-containing protein [Emticicia sp. 21SJ11W-3]